MPVTGEKVKVVHTSEAQFNNAIAAEQTDENTIYFVLGSDCNSIWVGDKLYSTGIPSDELSDWLQIEHKALTISTSGGSQAETESIDDWDDTLFNTVFTGGVFVNGLRSDDEFRVTGIHYYVTEDTSPIEQENPSVTQDDDSSSSIITYTPEIEYTPLVTYTEDVELIIDVYRLKFKPPMNESDVDTREENLPQPTV